MQHHSEYSWDVQPADRLLVCPHADTVSFYSSFHVCDGSDFAIRLTPAHLPTLRELVEALEALEVRQSTSTQPTVTAADVNVPAEAEVA